MMEAWHILPVDDLKEHEESAYCQCNPKIEEYRNGRLIIHNAYDGREIYEQAETNAKTNLN